MTVKTLCALDPNSMGPGLQLSLSNLAVSCNLNGADNLRLVRGTIGKADNTGVFFFEAAFWFDPLVLGAPTSPAGLISVGLANQVTGFSNYVGGGTNNFGFKAGDGGIWTNNAQVETSSPVNFSTGDKPWWIGIKYDTSTRIMTVYVNGSVVASHTLYSGYVWFPAITVSGPAAYSVYGFINCGQRAFEFPIPESDGWYSIGGTDQTLRYAAVDDGPYVAALTDTIPGAQYRAAIVDADNFSIARSSGVWPWTTSNDSVSFSQLTLANDAGALDSTLLAADYRDSKVRIMILDAGGALSDATVVGTAIVDSIKTNGESSATVTLKDPLVLLDKPLQQKLFPPFADVGVANTPLPIVLGACRNIDLGGKLFAPLNYKMSDAPITRVGYVYDMAAPLDPVTAQFVPSADQTAVILATDPFGKLTADVSSIGGLPVDTGNPDVLSGDGFFTSWAGTAPLNWTFSGGTGNTILKRGVAQGFDHDYYARITTSTTWNPNGSKFGAYISYDTSLLIPGRTYRLSLKVKENIGSPPTFLNHLEYGLQLRTGLNGLAADAISPNGQPIKTPVGVESSYSWEYTVPLGSPRKIYAIVSASEGSSPTSSSGAASVTFGNLTAQLLGIFVVQPLTGITYADYFREIFEVRGHLSPADWSLTDAQALDAATGHLLGVNITESVTIVEAAKKVLDTACAALFTDAAGVIRIRRLIDPEGATPLLSFDLSNVDYGVNVLPDYAPGLTNSAFARPNCSPLAEADFVSDEQTVPPAVRTQFKRIGQFTLTSAVSLKQSFVHAQQAPTILYRLDDPTQAQNEIDRVNGLYSTEREGAPAFLTFSAYYADPATQLYFGDVVSLTYPRYGFQDGANTFTVGSVLYPRSMSIEVTTWNPGVS